MKKIMLEQGSPAWRSFRKDHIGASDAPIIDGVGFTTPYKLWRNKLGLDPDQPINGHMQRGIDMEPDAREEFCKIMGDKFIPVVCEDVALPYISASFDGMNDNGAVVEIKCPGPAAHDMAIGGMIPSYYLPQLQHQMYVAGVEQIYYFSFSYHSNRVLVLERDDKYIDTLLEKEKAFWNCVQSFEEPPLSKEDYTLQYSDSWEACAREWKEARDVLKAYEEKEKQLREQLIAMSHGQNSRGAGVKLTKVIRRGTVKYSAIPELKSIDLDQYRGKPIESWRFSEDKE